MIKKLIPIMSATLILATLRVPAFAEENKAPEPPSQEQRDSWKEHKRPNHRLTDEEREKLKTAMESDAVKQDQAVQDSRKALVEAAKKHREALNAALLKQDPSLAPVLEKIKNDMRDGFMGDAKPFQKFRDGKRGRKVRPQPPEGTPHPELAPKPPVEDAGE